MVMNEAPPQTMQRFARPPVAQEKALADALRRKQEIGMALSLVGSDNQQRFGANLYSGAADKEKQMALSADKAAQRELTKGYYDQMNENQRLSRALQRERMEREDARARMKLSEKTYKTPPTKVQENANDLIGTVSTIDSLKNTFKDEYASNIGMGEGSVSNFLGKTPLGSDAQKEQALWWSEYDRQYTLPVRNRMFGSALTDTEKAAWAQANISPNSPPDVIKKGLESMEKIARDVAARQRVNDAALYDPEWVDTVYGQIDLTNPNDGDSPNPEAPAQNTYKGMTYEVIPD